MGWLISLDNVPCSTNVENEWMLSLVVVLLAVSALRGAASIEAREANIEPIGIILINVSNAI